MPADIGSILAIIALNLHSLRIPGRSTDVPVAAAVFQHTLPESPAFQLQRVLSW